MHLHAKSIGATLGKEIKVPLRSFTVYSIVSFSAQYKVGNCLTKNYRILGQKV